MGGAAWLLIFGLGKASTRKHIHPAIAGRPRSNATRVKKRRHPEDQSKVEAASPPLSPSSKNPTRTSRLHDSSAFQQSQMASKHLSRCRQLGHGDLMHNLVPPKIFD